MGLDAMHFLNALAQSQVGPHPTDPRKMPNGVHPPEAETSRVDAEPSEPDAAAPPNPEASSDEESQEPRRRSSRRRRDESDSSTSGPRSQA